LVGSPGGQWATDWSADEKYVIFVQTVQDAAGVYQGLDLYYLEQRDDGSGYDPVPYDTNPFNIASAKLSPDGNYLAYESDESGDFEIYVESFPQGGGKTKVSANGGLQPRWRGDGKELFYIEPESSSIVSVPVSTAGAFSADRPQRLFPVPSEMYQRPGHHYDVTPDGQKFLIVEDAEGETGGVSSIQITENWYEEFRNREQD
jgi:Tol biopolymer transport system component